jgi:hypothetical protein
MKRLLLALLIFVGVQHIALAASCGSYPFTLQNNTTADATQVMADFNTVRNCVINNAAGSGVNTDITSLTGLSTPLSVPQGGTPVFIGGTSTGSANAQSVASTTPIGYSLTNGYRVTFTAGFTNTAATTLNVNSTGATAMRRIGSSGLEALTGGEIISGNIVEAVYNGTFFVLLNTPLPLFNALTTLASATTTDLGTIGSHNVSITGTTTITGFGSTAVATDPIYLISFTGALTLTYNATSLIIPGSGNITTANGDTATVEYLGSGNWRVLQYTKRSGAGVVAITPLCGATGFSLTNNAGTPDTSIDIAADNVVMLNSSNGVTFSASAVSATINTTTNGAVNRLDAGSLAASTWYNFYLISDGTTTGGLASTSATAPTMPTNYVYKCRLGAMRTDGSVHFFRTLQKGNWTQWKVTSATNTAAFPSVGTTTSATLVALGSTSSVVPPTATQIRLYVTANVGATIAISSNNATSTSLGTNPSPMQQTNGTSPSMSGDLFLETINVYAATNAGTLSAFAVGWKDATNAN